ncbi:MAG: sulfurtransferase FdhD, partial [Acidobacteriota bacterium]
MSRSVSNFQVLKFPELQSQTDVLAVEEPLEIRLGFYDKDKFTHKAISITMRTPDHDFELAAG